MSDVEKSMIVLTPEQTPQSLSLERLIDWATINCRGDQCDTARFAPKKIGGVVVPRMIGGVEVKRSLSWEGAVGIADGFRACKGPSQNGMCRYQPHTKE